MHQTYRITMMNSLTWWLILFVVSVLLELSSPGLFFFVSFSLGAAAAAGVSLLDLGMGIEFTVFLLVSAISFVLLRQYVKGLSKDTLHKTNVYALLGKKGIITEQVSLFKKGWVKIDGELWAAAPLHEEIIEVGAQVEVVSSSGSHLIVKKHE